MGNPLRDRRTPQEFAASGQTIVFEEKINGFEQLAAIVEGDLETLDPAKIPSGWRDTAIAGQLSFGFADAQNGLPVLTGEAGGKIDAVCQRCLEPMKLPVQVELKLLFAGRDSMAADDHEIDVWELEEETFRPIDIVEEALIMALPLAAMHDDKDGCHGPEDDDAGPGDKIRPFAALKAQMEQNN